MKKKRGENYFLPNIFQGEFDKQNNHLMGIFLLLSGWEKRLLMQIKRTGETYADLWITREKSTHFFDLGNSAWRERSKKPAPKWDHIEKSQLMIIDWINGWIKDILTYLVVLYMNITEYATILCYGLTCVCWNSYVEALISNVTVFGGN